MRILKHSIFLVLSLVILAQNGETRPFRGFKNWQVILCAPLRVNVTQAPKVSFFADMIFSDKPGSVNTAWKQLSRNGFYINGNVNGWYPMTKNSLQYKALSRDDKVNYCRGAATSAGYVFKQDTGIMYVTYPDFGLFSGAGYAFFAYNSPVSFFVYEVGSALGLEHSFTANYGYRNAANGSAPGERGNAWDAMSRLGIFSVNTPFHPTRWDDWGPGLNAYNLDRMGWVPQNRIFRFGANGVHSTEVTLAPLSAPEKEGYLMARIQIDTNDLFKYLTVEYRVRQVGSLDAGLPFNKVLVNEVRRRNDSGTLRYNSYLIMQNNTGPFDPKNPVTSFSANQTKIQVISSNFNGAKIRITSLLPKRCLRGYAWRKATKEDYICVLETNRDLTQMDNALQGRRLDRYLNCLPGWVKRKANAWDSACVSPSVAAQVYIENYYPSRNLDPTFGDVMKNGYGPNTCKAGYVWRNADNSDWVCVTPAVKAQVATDNAQASTRWVSGASGPNTCINGYVWRQAFPGDKVCVTPSIQSDTRNDNLDSNNRLAMPNA